MNAMVSAGMVYPSRTVVFMTFRIVQPVEQTRSVSLNVERRRAQRSTRSRVILSSMLPLSRESDLFSSVMISVRISDVRLGELKI